MATPSTKTLSPAELAKLEHAFATDPASEAYKPLAEAYLGMGRFMEAMVVCKKGVKAHPNTPDPRVLLARVYAEQGKDKKALEEIQGALTVSPADKIALRMAGALQMKTGETEPGKANLLKAYDADPADAETLAVLSQYKVEPPKAAPPPPPPQPVAPPPQAVAAQAPQAPIAGPGTRANEAPPPGAVIDNTLAEKPRASQKHRVPQNGGASHQRYEESSSSASASYEAPPPPKKKKKTPREELSYSQSHSVSKSVEAEATFYTKAKKTNASSAKKTLIIIPIVMVGIAIWGGWSRHKSGQKREISKAGKRVIELIKKDTYASYQGCIQACEEVLDIDSSNVRGHAYRAYCQAIRWGEHAGGDEARKQAEEDLAEAREEARKEGDPTIYAAEGLIKSYSGKGGEAAKELEDLVKDKQAKGERPALMLLTLGMIQMNLGDLEHARENLEAAQAIVPDDARTYAALGTLNRRRGMDSDAWRNFDFALRYQTDHPDSMIGKSMLILDSEEPGTGYCEVSRMLKKLIDSQPPPSPRQLATAHVLRALLVSRVTLDLPRYKADDFKKKLTECTGLNGDKAAATSEITKEEDQGFGMDRTNPELNLIKGKRLAHEENVDGAIQEYQKAINLDGSRAHYHVELARALREKKDFAGAESALKKALGMNPTSPKLIAMLGHVFMNQGKLDEALSQYEKAVREPGSKNPEARISMGKIYREKKDFLKAIEAFTKAAQEYVGQSWNIAEAHDEMGQTYELMNQKDKAEDSYKKTITVEKDFDPGYCHLAKVLSANGKRADAHTAATTYLQQFPKGECADEMKRY
jgi:cellulose synthase operon protein C